MEELRFKSIAGPFLSPQISGLHLNRFGVIPKSTPGKFRLITDLFSPPGSSVNDLIPDSEAAVSYTGISAAFAIIVKFGQVALLAKFDISRAYCLLPMHPNHHHYLGMFWKDRFFVDLALPFGLRSASRIFSRFAEVLLAILKSSNGGPYLQNYLDDFLIISAPTPNLCQSQLSQWLCVCHLLGIPIAPDRTEGPSSSLTFLFLSYFDFLFDPNR